MALGKGAALGHNNIIQWMHAEVKPTCRASFDSSYAYRILEDELVLVHEGAEDGEKLDCGEVGL